MNNAKLLNQLWRLTPASMANTLSAGKFKRFNYIDYISDEISKAVLAGNRRLIISCPPRHGKSTLISTWTPTWFLSLFPEKNVILCSYEADFAASWGRQVRNLIDEHKLKLGIALSDDSRASDRWNTTKGGGMITAGVGGPITGRGGHLILIDDPIKNAEQAYSEVYRKKTVEWYNTTLRTRLEPEGTIIVLMTRWHEDDLVGHLLTQTEENWKEIRFSAIANDDDDILNRKLGDALCPERYPTDKLLQTKATIGSKAWNALYQQVPTADEGNLIKRTWFKTYDNIPDAFDQTYQSWDLTFKDSKHSDFVVGQLWGRLGANYYLIDQVRERMNFTDTLSAIRSFSHKHYQCHGILVEDKANGPAIISVLQNEISGIIPIDPEGSKESRVSSILPLLEAGNIFIPESRNCNWVDDFTNECASFPFAKHDDQVDAMTQALIKMKYTVIQWTPCSIESRFSRELRGMW